MGTSGGGSSGSGSGITSGSGGGTRGLGSGGNSSDRGFSYSGGFYSEGGIVKTIGINEADIKKEVNDLFEHLFSSADHYMHEMFGNHFIKEIYSDVFSLHDLLKGDNLVELICDKYGINPTSSGFLIQLIDKIVSDRQNEDIDYRCIQVIRLTLEKFFIKSIDNDYDLSLTGTAPDVLTKMKLNNIFWKSTSGNFLFEMIKIVYKKEMEGRHQSGDEAVEKELERRSNSVITTLIKPDSKGNFSYRELFVLIDSQWDVLVNKLCNE